MKNIGLLVIVTASLSFLNTAHATIWYVHPDSALNSIQAGLDSCSTDDTVLVSPGIYYENIIWPITQGIDLISEYGADTTIIDGSGQNRVITIDSLCLLDTNTIIRGFAVRNGDSNIGGGIRCGQNSSPTICCNKIINNTAMGGGGISCRPGSSPVITDNDIMDNYADLPMSWGGGGIYCYYSSAIISRNTIVYNTAEGSSNGGGVSCYNSSPVISKNIICENVGGGGGGISCAASSPIIDSNTISNNIWSGIWCESVYGVSSEPVIKYNNITGNTAAGGFGIYNRDPTIIVDAENNWWGDVTGPYHPTLNPHGVGDSVSDYVDFDPWLIVPVGVGEQPVIKPIETNEFHGATILSGPLQLPEGKQCKVFDITGRIVEPTRITHGIYFIEIDDRVVQKVVKIR